MKNYFILVILFLSSINSFSQEGIKMKINSGYSTDLQTLLLFEEISIDEIVFSGKELVGKNYQINIKEFKKNILIKTTTLFDSSEDEYFRIKEEKIKFKIAGKITDKKEFKIQIFADRFASRKESFTLLDNNLRYVVKNFLGSKSEIDVPVNKAFYILSLITPTKHKDGSSSYCEVAQSNFDPEKFGDKYDIPHYYLIEMKFN
ncbi:hypothetical protein [Flavobacterium sp. '19STA2R22 D10 B1']|uniref:hypothetical protein n=1 Tax=Flavobacterium aerium TaxID=3037261 RepID=UPI00278C8808|nr:hypothetical protein [Flavobacterium sp. '19STA2R22 D10 B1']